MFKALGRVFKSFIYIITFQLNKLSEVWGSSAGAIAASYDDIRSKHQASIHQVKRAVASIMTVQEKKKNRLKQLELEINKYNKLLSGAQAMGQKVIAKLQLSGTSLEEIKTHPEYVKCGSAYKDFSSTLKAKKEEAEVVAEEVQINEKQLGEYEAQLHGMVRELKTIEQEKHETIADVTIARQQAEANDLIAGISQSNSAEERQRLQDMRQRLKAEVKISSRIAGVDADHAEKEFLEYAEQSEASSEFDSIMGLSPPPEVPKITDQRVGQMVYEVKDAESFAYVENRAD